jgi:hypothetical protein
MQPAVSVRDVSKVLPAWLRPGAFALVACLHLVILYGIPWPARTDIAQSPPVEIQVIPQPEPASLLVPLESAPAVEVKPATAAPVDVQAAEAQPLHQGKEIAELKPEPAFALNSPPGVLASPAPHESPPLAARPPTAALQVAQPAPQAAGAEASASSVAPATQVALPPSAEQVAESLPLDVPAAAAAEDAQPAREAASAAVSALPIEPPSRPMVSAQQVAESQPLEVRPAADRAPQPASEAPSATAPASPIEPPSRPLAFAQQAAEAQPLDVPPAAAAEVTQPAHQAASATASAFPIEPSSRPLAPGQQVAESQPEVRPAAADQAPQPAHEAASAAASVMPIEPPSRPLASAERVAKLQPLDVPPAAVAEVTQPAHQAASAAESALPIEPASRPLTSEQQLVESKPELLPAAPVPPVQAVGEAQGAEAPALPIEPPSRPLSSGQQMAELAPLGVPHAAVPVPIAPTAPQLPKPDSSGQASGAPAPGTVLPSEQTVAKLEPVSPGTAAPLQDEGPAMPGRIAQIVRYVEHYDGGDCFFVAPVEVTESAARLEGYGASAQPFEALNTAFLHANGFEADIDVRLVSPAQCRAVTILGQLRANAPHLTLSLGPGDVLTGSVEGFGSRNVELLVATDAGTVQNVTHLLRSDAASKTFTIVRRDIAWASAGQPQLLIVIASRLPLDTLRFDRPIAADRLFPAVLGEAARTHQPVAAMARYFKIEPGR